MSRSPHRWLDPVTLLLPALLPSWRFFASVGPSPRIQCAWVQSEKDTEHHWEDFRPRPAHLSFGAMLRSLIWNPAANETLYLIACCERLLEQPDEHWQNEIRQRVLAELSAKPKAAFFRYRIVLVERNGTSLITEPAFVSPIRRLETRTENLAS
jgi:hypothetical protein